MQSYKDIPVQNTFKINEEISLVLSTDHKVLFDFIEKNKELFLNTMKWVKDFNTIEDSKIFIEAWKKGYEEGTKLCYFIMSGENLAGFFCFRTLDFQTKESEIGYMMDSAFAGRGILRQSIRFMLDYAIEKYSIERFTLITTSLNERSQNVGTKLGFTLFKTDKNGMEINGVMQDQLTFELTTKKYLELKEQEKQKNAE